MNTMHLSKLILPTIISGIGAALFGGIMVSVFGGEFATGAVYGGLLGAAGMVLDQYPQRRMLSGAAFGGAFGAARSLLSGDPGEAVVAIITGVVLGALLGTGIGWLLDIARANIPQDA